LDFAGPSGAGRRSAGGTSSAGSAEHYTIGTETRLRPFLEPGGYMRLRLLRAPTLAATVLTAALASSNAGAHHSFSAEFDIGRPVEITGTVTKIEWTNPHAWIHLETEADGKREEWAVEMLGINALVRSGVSPTTVKAGDKL